MTTNLVGLSLMPFLFAAGAQAQTTDCRSTDQTVVYHKETQAPGVTVKETLVLNGKTLIQIALAAGEADVHLALVTLGSKIYWHSGTQQIRAIQIKALASGTSAYSGIILCEESGS